MITCSNCKNTEGPFVMIEWKKRFLCEECYTKYKKKMQAESAKIIKDKILV